MLNLDFSIQRFSHFFSIISNYFDQLRDLQLPKVYHHGGYDDSSSDDNDDNRGGNNKGAGNQLTFGAYRAHIQQ